MQEDPEVHRRAQVGRRPSRRGGSARRVFQFTLPVRSRIASRQRSSPLVSGSPPSLDRRQAYRSLGATRPPVLLVQRAAFPPTDTSTVAIYDRSTSIHDLQLLPTNLRLVRRSGEDRSGRPLSAHYGSRRVRLSGLILQPDFRAESPPSGRAKTKASARRCLSGFPRLGIS